MEDAQPLADYVMATVEGALLMARVQHDTQPFKNAAENFKALVDQRQSGSSSGKA